MHGKEQTFKRESSYSEVNLSTIHGAKGLESKIVYVDIGSLDSAKKHECNLKTNKTEQKNYDETTRLEYVAYTRAKDKLVITAPYTCSYNSSTGKYHLNERLLNAYKAAGKVYGFNYQSLITTVAQEKQAEKNPDDVKEFFNVKLDTVRQKDLSLKKVRKEQENNLENQTDFSDIGLMLS